ncbi:MAG TPA: GNAT family N-acetyltransferase, partial [Gammaproteobacteria bacterium]|nr:GNAT family N-acetyltransferase [Gammaproteobacteria bacterium]
YGEAKQHEEAWGVSHLIILKNQVPVAVCQLLQKKLFGLFCLYRINRGPVWLSSSVGYLDKIACLSLLKKRFSGILSRKVLSIAPELSEDINHYYLLSLLGYYHVKKQPYSSVTIDLSQSEDLLRKQLAGKWRNQLCSAEKLEVSVEVEYGADALTWLLKKYHDFKESKDFSGVSEKLIHYMSQQALDPECFVTLRAKYQGEYVAGILVYRHGQTATYFVGWNGEAGRKIHVNNLLLWHAILELKSIHCSYFDLGGVDVKNTQAISHFKQGVRGDAYSLLGEFVCL